MPSTRRQLLAALAAGAGTATATTVVGRPARDERPAPPGSDADAAGTPSATASDDPATHVWARRYRSTADASNEGLDVVRAHDGGVVLLWRDHDSWHLQRLAPDGRPGWSTRPRGDVFRGSLVRVPDGYVVVGEDTERHSTVVVRTDARGRTTATGTLSVGSDETGPLAATRTTDGGVAVIGYPGVEPARAFVAKLDADGAVAWTHVVDPPETRLRDVTAAPDGGAYAVGTVDGPSNTPKDAVALQLSAEGDVRWQRSYGGAHRDGYYAVTTTTNGFLAGGMRARGERDRPRALVLHDATGTPVWRRAGSGDPFVDALAFEDGYLAVSSSQSASAVVRTDRWGRERWDGAVSPVPGPVVERTVAVAPVDGGYVFAGTRSADEAGASDALALKLTPPADA